MWRSEWHAPAAAISIGADKLIGLIEGPGLIDAEGLTPTQLTPREAEQLLHTGHDFGHDVERHLRTAIEACRGGVARAHLVARQNDGSLLRELFTRDGVGTMVTSETFEGVRPAERGDVGGILSLIEPLEEQGVLVRRSKEMLENDIERFMVIERDGMVVASAALYAYPDEQIAELACLVVHPDYRTSGRGDQLLHYLERECAAQGLRGLFALTTQTSHWFRERGFDSCELEELPEARLDHLRGHRNGLACAFRRFKAELLEEPFEYRVESSGADVLGRRIKNYAAALPADQVAAVEKRGRELDLWETAESLVAETEAIN